MAGRGSYYTGLYRPRFFGGAPESRQSDDQVGYTPPGSWGGGVIAPNRPGATTNPSSASGRSSSGLLGLQSEGIDPNSSYAYWQNRMRRGMYTPAQMDYMASGQARAAETGFRGAQAQAANRAAGMGVTLPWLWGSGDSQGLIQASAAGANARMGLDIENQQSRDVAAGALGDWDKYLSQLALIPTATDELPPWLQSLWDQVQKIIAEQNGDTSGAGATGGGTSGGSTDLGGRTPERNPDILRISSGDWPNWLRQYRR